MKKIHNPIIDLRYWFLIFLVSIFGTNTGDLAVRWFSNLINYFEIAPPLLRHIGPLPFLALIFIAIWFLERSSKNQTEIYFWSAIIVIRTAATNLADSMLGDLSINFYLLATFFSSTLLYLALKWQNQRSVPTDSFFILETTAQYWVMMAFAGILGTIIGDHLADSMGLFNASLLTTLIMMALVYFGHKKVLPLTAFYWFGIVFARISGTDIGDWLAKSITKGGAGFGLPLATFISGSLFFFVLYKWRSSVKTK